MGMVSVGLGSFMDVDADVVVEVIVASVVVEVFFVDDFFFSFSFVDIVIIVSFVLISKFFST